MKTKLIITISILMITFWFGQYTVFGNNVISNNDTTVIIYSMKSDLIIHSTTSGTKEIQRNDVLFVKLDTVNDDYIFIAKTKLEHTLSTNSIESYISAQGVKKKLDQLNSLYYFEPERYRFAA